MSAATKVTIAIVVLFAAVLGIYYGFGGPDGTAAVPPELLPPAEADPAAETGVAETASLAGITRENTGNDLARSIEEALWAQGGATTTESVSTSVLGSDGGGVQQPDDPWVLRAPTLMPEPEKRPLQSTASPRTVEYVVQPDDSMWTISKRWFGDATRWREIARGNPEINPDRLQVGQRLQLPAGNDTPSVGLNRAAAIPVAARSTPQSSGGSSRYYTVRSGDTLSTIAESYYRSETRWHEIYDANRGTVGGNPDRLAVGMKLRIP